MKKKIIYIKLYAVEILLFGELNMFMKKLYGTLVVVDQLLSIFNRKFRWFTSKR
jgi:hypothetical protein